MLKKYLLFLILIKVSTLFGQVPQKFNYQGIARDNKGNPMAQQRMTIKLTVLPTTDATIGEYEEIQSITTNEFGLYTLQIGNGTPITGEMKAVKWETGNKYIKVAIDPKGCNDFVEAGTNQLLSVPYAIYADKAGMAKTAGGDRTGVVNSAAGHVAGDANYLSKFTALNTIGKSQLYDNGTSVGIGTTTPTGKFHVNTNSASVIELIRMRNSNSAGAGRFTMYGDLTTSYATFSKYGSTYSGGYTGISTLFPYANLLAFGNNNGGFLLSNSGNIGLSILKGGSSNLKFYSDFNTGYIGIGGNANPTAKVHFNTSATNDTIKFTNSTTGHTIVDGSEIRTTGNNTRLVNRENAYLLLGTNNTDRLSITGNGNVGIGIITPSYLLQVNGDSATVADVNGTGTLHSTGIFRSEYTGNVADDHIAIVGRSVPSLTDNHGIGVYAEGGYIGINGFAKCASALSVFGSINESYSRGETYGTYSIAQSDTTTKGGLKYGLFANAAGGNSNYGVYGTADTTGAPTTSYAGYFEGKTQVVGNMNVTGNMSKGAGTFKIDHPLDPENKYLYHSFVESPDMMNVYNGNCVTNANGESVVELPSYFEALNKDFRYQLTCIGQPALVWVEKKINNNHFVIKSDKPNVEISWQITGIRQDAYANNHRVIAEVEKETENKGKYLHPIDFKQSEQKGIYYKKSQRPERRLLIKK